MAAEKRIACVGECMIEVALDREDPARAKIGYGGDTLNTAVYLSRCLGSAGPRCSYVTWLGDDGFADAMIRSWAEEGLDVDLIHRASGRMTGLYTISVDDSGERRFDYWRSAAPARDMFSGADGEGFATALKDFDVLYFSGVTLAILRPDGRDRLLAVASRIREAGGEVVFDTNFRPSLWDTGRPADTMREALALATMALPSEEDLRNIFGDASDDWSSFMDEVSGGEVVLRKSATRLAVRSDGKWTPFELNRSETVVDTTAAGDSFNAAYLATRLLGGSVSDAVANAHSLANRVIAHPGAIISAGLMPHFSR